MVIGIDCRMLGPEQGGIGRYVEQLVKHLLEIDRENQYILFLRKENLNNFQFSIFNFQLNTVLVDIPWYSWKEQTAFNPIIRKQNLDLMHFPHWNVPIFYNDPFVVTIHDIIMFHYPRPEATTLGPAKFWLKDRMHRIVIRHAVGRAQHILVTSEFTKRDVHETLGVPMERMTVTYQAPFGTKKQETRNKKQILEKYGIGKPFVLYVGAAYPHKNLEGLLKAWKLFVEKYGEGYQLVLAGKENYFYKKIRSPITDHRSLIHAGFIPDNDLATLYEHASLYVFPSLYEGFGLPPLEAQAFGVPTVSSNRTCLPEVLGESALYFDPENYEQMADVIHRGLTDENTRFELKQNAAENSSRFSWEKLAGETLEVYSRFRGERRVGDT